MDQKKSSYKYQPLEDFANANHDDAQIHDKLIDSYELSTKDTDGFRDDSEDASNDIQKKGIGIWTAGLFIIGEICGAGALAFPLGLSKSGLFGLLVIFLVIVMSTYCGLLLGQSWMKIKETHSIAGPVRDPFPYIGEIAVGKPMRHAVTIMLATQLFLTCVVYLILASGILSSFVSFHIGDVHGETQANLRIWMLIVSVVIFPFLLLGTPKDFWFVALIAAASTTIALILVWTKYFLVADENAGKPVPQANVTMFSFASAFGTFVFGFTGASLFPTIQTDMKKPEGFASAIYLGYIGIAFLYIPTAIGGYFTFGKNMKASIIETLSDYDRTHNTNRVLVSVAEILFAGHFLTGFVLMINPLLQQLEEFFNLPHEFSLKRVALRGTVLVGLLTSAEIFPKFGPIVDLVGGSINVLICFIFPIWFYLKLFPNRKLLEKILLALICVIAVLAGIVSTVSNVINVINTFHHLYASNSTANAVGT